MKRPSLLASALALAMLAGCGTNGTDLPQKPQIEPDVTELGFEAPLYRVCVGMSQPQTVQLHDGGREDLVISKIEITGTHAGLFSFWPDVPLLPMTVASENAVPVTVFYAPTVRGSHSAKLRITSNAENHPVLEIPMSALAADMTDDPVRCNPNP
jgi:hypothetical protein